LIIDNFENINLYKKISIDIFTGLDFLRSAGKDIEIGTYRISPNVKAIVEEYSTKNHTKYEFESHKDFIDIQYPIVGMERIFWSPISMMELKNPYNKGTDKSIYVSKKETQKHFVDIGNSIFAIMFESDGHSPQHSIEINQNIKKITIKVRKS